MVKTADSRSGSDVRLLVRSVFDGSRMWAILVKGVVDPIVIVTSDVLTKKS
jgi:hypothetical protein